MKLIHRPLYFNELINMRNTPDIKIITGIRRCGKSKLLSSFAEHIKAESPTTNIIYIDLTKLEFEPLKEYHALNEYVGSHYIDGVDNCLMIDEIQLCEKFELAVNSLHSEGRYDIYITGSNAFLLSSDLATLFTGRFMEIHVYPFSFKEYCTYYDNPADIQSALNDYIVQGGLAGSYVYPDNTAKTRYVRDVYETILIRDLVAKYKLGDAHALRKIGEYLMDNVGNISSFRNVSNALTGNGTTSNHVTVGSYIGYLRNAFVFYEAKRYDVKGKTYLQSLNKYYLADTGLRYAILGKRNMDWGRMLENIVYIELLRRGYEVYVGKLYKKEIDFVAINNNEKIYIQVSDNISDKTTFKRETDPLLQIRDAYPKMLLARTPYPASDYNGIIIRDIAEWLLYANPCLPPAP